MTELLLDMRLSIGVAPIMRHELEAG